MNFEKKTILKEEAQEKNQILCFQAKIRGIESFIKDYLNDKSDKLAEPQSYFLNKYVSALKVSYGITNERLAEHWDIKPETLSQYLTN